MSVREVTPQELAERLAGGASVVLLDVRQPEEYELVRLEGSVLVPLDELPGRLEEVRGLFAHATGDVVVYCRSGGRSGSACQWLAEQGVKNAVNLVGGINRYAREVDTSLTPY